MEIVVDTSVVRGALDHADRLAALRCVMERGHLLALDHDGAIFREYHKYRDELFAFGSPVAPWLAQMLGFQSVMLDVAPVTCLGADLNNARCDPADTAFVLTAIVSDSHLLVHEDRGYDRPGECCTYLSELGVLPVRCSNVDPIL